MESRELTKDEVRKEFLDSVRSLVRYWQTLPDKTPEERVDGVAFSILSHIDGCSTAGPGFSLIVDYDEDHNQELKEEDRNTYPKDCDISGSLHELFYE